MGRRRRVPSPRPCRGATRPPDALRERAVRRRFGVPSSAINDADRRLFGSPYRRRRASGFSVRDLEIVGGKFGQSCCFANFLAELRAPASVPMPRTHWPTLSPLRGRATAEFLGLPFRVARQARAYSFHFRPAPVFFSEPGVIPASLFRQRRPARPPTHAEDIFKNLWFLALIKEKKCTHCTPAEKNLGEFGLHQRGLGYNVGSPRDKQPEARRLVASVKSPVVWHDAPQWRRDGLLADRDVALD